MNARQRRRERRLGASYWPPDHGVTFADLALEVARERSPGCDHRMLAHAPMRMQCASCGYAVSARVLTETRSVFL